MNFYECLIEYSSSSKKFVQVSWVWANTIGKAIELMTTSATTYQNLSAEVKEISFANFEDLPEKSVKTLDNGKTYFFDHMVEFEQEDTDMLPKGVVIDGESQEFNYSDYNTGFETCKDKLGRYCLTVNANTDVLYSIVKQFITDNKIASYDINVLEAWDYQSLPRTWSKNKIFAVEELVEFNQQFFQELIANGFVSIELSDAKSNAVLKLSHQKTLHLTYFKPDDYEQKLFFLKRMGLARQKGMLNLTDHYDCYLYHSTDTLPPTKFSLELEKHEFVSKINVNIAEANANF